MAAENSRVYTLHHNSHPATRRRTNERQYYHGVGAHAAAATQLQLRVVATDAVQPADDRPLFLHKSARDTNANGKSHACMHAY